MGKPRKGFKAEANRISENIRIELGIGLFNHLDPYSLANYLGIPIRKLTQLDLNSNNASYFIELEPEAFSAVTVFCGPSRLIVHNDGHAPVRQTSNLMHELSHALLQHPPSPAIGDYGCRIWDEEIEAEAEWLAGALLVPEKAAVAVARGRWGDMNNAASHFGVSKAMLTYRLNVTGARFRASFHKFRSITKPGINPSP